MRDLTFCVIAFVFAFAFSAMVFRFLSGPTHALDRRGASVSLETAERELRDGRLPISDPLKLR